MTSVPFLVERDDDTIRTQNYFEIHADSTNFRFEDVHLLPCGLRTKTLREFARDKIRRDITGILFVEAHIESCQFAERFQCEVHFPPSRELADADQDRREPPWSHSLFGEIMHSVSENVKGYCGVLWEPPFGRSWVVREAKMHDLQNRMGFVVGLARELAVRVGDARKARSLANLEARLDHSRLAREDTLCRASMPEPERRWLAEHRPEAAKHWNLLTDWTADALRYAV